MAALVWGRLLEPSPDSPAGPSSDQGEDGAFLWTRARGEAETGHATRREQAKRRAYSGTLEKECRKPPLPQKVTLMVSVSVPGVHSWGNLHYLLVLVGALGLSLRHGDGLRALFLFGHGVAGAVSPYRMVGANTRLFV